MITLYKQLKMTLCLQAPRQSKKMVKSFFWGTDTPNLTVDHYFTPWLVSNVKPGLMSTPFTAVH